MYLRIDQDDNNKIGYDEMTGFFGPHMPSKASLDVFDSDHDGYYSLEELISAFGFTVPTLTPTPGNPVSQI